MQNYFFIITLATIIFFSAFGCTNNSQKFISLFPSNIKNNDGKIINIEIESRNSLQENLKRCAKESLFVFTYKVKNTENQNYKNFKIKKSDIYLLVENKKISPRQIFTTNSELENINSEIFIDKNQKNSQATQYVLFKTPCKTLLNKDSRLIIEKIYKGEKIIKKELEFSFKLTNTNKAYNFWIE